MTLTRAIRWSLPVLGLIVIGGFVLLLTVPESSTAEPTSTPAPLATHSAAADALAALRDPDVPPLPFPDNPDPSLCGIPVTWGETDSRAYLSGLYQGELVQPEVLLYDSHSRLSVKARAPHGARVRIILFQANPVTDYYMVKIEGQEPPNEGWVPAPFLSFEPVSAGM